MKYEIANQPFTTLAFRLTKGETILCQAGAMAWMTPTIRMETKTGGVGKMFKKAVMGESLALNHYTAEEDGEIVLAKQCAGDILLFNITQTPIIAQKSSLLAMTPGVNFDIYLQKKLATGLLGGEGFIMQKYSGQGYAFLEIDGGVVEKVLQPGERIIIDTGYVAAMEATCTMEIQTIKGVSNVLLGGEGLFNTVVTGPGKVWLQTMPLYNLAQSIMRYIPSSN